ncbi:MAG: site-specific DNA-methyltransferase [bacterium]|nr:site-specific DNA-methyltransferase [bacterium]
MASTLEDKSKEELIGIIKHLKKRKKFGLVWEEKPEDVVEQCKKELPVLEEVKDKTIAEDSNGPTNLLIEGDNYHSLSVLNYTHAGKIDVIYIDPPYNTGARDWKYNNHFVDSNDTYRHSKWVAMMHKRLILAKNLLKQDGVLIVTIDDNEFSSLGLLLDEIFPNKVRTTVVIKYNPAGTARSGFSRCHEYAIYLLNPGQEINKKPAPPDIRSRNLRRNGNNSDRSDSPTMFYPIYVDKTTLKVIGVGEAPGNDFHPEKQTFEHNDRYEVWPLDENNKEKNWYYSRKRVEDKGSEELVGRVVKEKVHLYFSTSNNSEQKYQTVWTGSEYDAGAYGSSLVKEIIDTKFPFPKSLYAVRDCIKSVIKSKEAIVLDFFAGSGTTGHATMLLNKEDGGNRQFILCTNNENGIAEEITYPRIKNTISGYSNIEGIPANLRYFKTSFVSKSKVSDDTRRELVKRSSEMICVRENTFEETVDTSSFKIYKDSEHLTGILFDLNSIDDFKKTVREQKLPANIYVFSLTNDTYDEDFEDLGIDHNLCPIPESILEVYRKVFRRK